MKRLPPLNALKAFAVAAREGSFTHAGEVLHVTQGAISRQVKQLETALGVPLFVRVHQAVELTPAGRELADTLGRLFAEMEVAVNRAAGQHRPEVLTVNAPPTFATRWLAPRLSDFRARFPHIDLSITTDRITTLREARSLDCMVVFDTQAWPRTPCEPVMKERHVMVSSPSLWRASKPPALPGATLLHVLDGGQRLPVWEQWIAQHGPLALDVRPGLTFSTLDQAISAAIAGAGVVIVDEAMVVRELQSGELIRHNTLYVEGPFAYWFVVPSSEPTTPARVHDFKTWLMQKALPD
ncbi:LysR substrate-binding domain-containing protein [Rhodoferax lacus]|uniref:LysR substrate-binding domain-containing protein n=1 Tax=Rhodoferax lacus TaxID=2184758 RepID=UPI0013144F52|nr:LysR substrate-binding domain-containing protein [Rhodoferax lacus]